MQNKIMVALSLAIISLFSSQVNAQGAWPERAVKIVVPYPAGPGPADTIARIVGEQLYRQLSQPFIVDNRAGASGNISTDFVVKSPADGYTLLLGAIGPIVINPAIFKGLNFDPLKDLRPVSYVGAEGYVLVANPSVGAASVKELVAMIKERPNRFSFASSGVGSGTHVAAELFQHAAGVKLLHVPYKGGTPGLNDVVSGQVSLTFTTVPMAANFMRTGKLQALAITGSKRAAILPDTPTMAEAGYPEAVFNGWYGFFVPARTPKKIVERIHAQIDLALSEPEVRKKIEDLSIQIQGKTDHEFSDFVRFETERLGRTIRAANISVD